MSGMDFFGHQEQAQVATRRLVVLFVCAVLAMIGCIYAAAAATMKIGMHGSAWQPEVLLLVTVGTLAIVATGTAYKTSQLRSGGRTVATLLGGRLVPPETTDPQERMLRNIVEEMAIAAGVPVPEVYVLDEESGINAFAAGWSPADAAVAVTRGGLEHFDRDELQGVIAHEFSHIFHGDMRLNIRLMSVLFGIVCITTIGRILVRVVGSTGGRRSNGKGGGGAAGVVLFGVALIVIGYLGVLFARLIQAAVSRQREYLADASAVQYTRNPRGIGMALAKIGGYGAVLRSAHSESASHMLFADGMKRFLGGGFATHPPLEERVERIMPGFKRHLAAAPTMAAAAAQTEIPAATMASLAGAAGLAGGTRGIRSADLVESVGTASHRHVEAARELLRDLPLELVAAARESARAHALTMALLLDRDPSRRKAQLDGLAARDPALAHDASVLFQARLQASPRAMLPLLELCIPALRGLPSAAREQVRADARVLAMADDQLTPFEFGLLKSLDRHVRTDGEPLRARGRRAALVDRLGDATVVLSALARVGTDDGDDGDDTQAVRAFAQGTKALGLPGEMTLLPKARCSLLELERAVDALAPVSPFGKRNLLAACAAAIGADGKVTAEEADLLRALAEFWDCPIPLVTTPEGAAASESFTA